jgi:hypothetical protein
MTDQVQTGPTPENPEPAGGTRGTPADATGTSPDYKAHPFYVFASGVAIGIGAAVAVFHFFINENYTRTTSCREVVEKTDKIISRSDYADLLRLSAPTATVGVPSKVPVDPIDRGLVDVATASLGNFGAISPATCTLQAPCAALARGSALELRLTQRGYAGVFIQDGGYYLQDGRLAINGTQVGGTNLWPGTEKSIDRQVYALWVVVSQKPIPVSGDSTALESLPLGPDLHEWGPVYLSIIEPSLAAHEPKRRPTQR